MGEGLSNSPIRSAEENERVVRGELEQETVDELAEESGFMLKEHVTSHDENQYFSEKFEIDSKHLPLMRFFRDQGFTLNYKTKTITEEGKDPVNKMHFYVTYKDSEGKDQSRDIYEDTSFNESKLINAMQQTLNEVKGGILLNSYLEDSSYENPVFLKNEKKFKTALDTINRINSVLPGDKLALSIGNEGDKTILNIKLGDKVLQNIDINDPNFEDQLWNKLQVTLLETGKKTLPDNEFTRMFVYMNDNFQGSPAIKWIALALLKSGAFSGAFGGYGNKSFMDKVKDGNLGKETFTDKEQNQMAESRMLGEAERQEMVKDVVEGNNTMSSLWYLTHSLWHSEKGDEFIDNATPDGALSVSSLAAKLEFSRVKSGEDQLPLYKNTTVADIQKEPKPGSVVFFTVGELFLNHFGLTMLFQSDSKASEMMSGFINEKGQMEFYANGKINTMKVQDLKKMKVNFQLAYEPTEAYSKMQGEKKNEVERENYPENLKNKDKELSEAQKILEEHLKQLTELQNKIVSSKEKVKKLYEINDKVAELNNKIGTSTVETEKTVFEGQKERLLASFNELSESTELTKIEENLTNLQQEFDHYKNDTRPVLEFVAVFREWDNLINADEKLKGLATLKKKREDIEKYMEKHRELLSGDGSVSLF